MKPLTPLVLALVLLAGCSSETNPIGANEPEAHRPASPAESSAARKASTSLERTVINLDVTLPFVGDAVPCVGEKVRIYGPVAVRIHTTTDGRGRTHQVAYYDWTDVVAEGEDSGNLWRTAAALELYTMSNFELTAPFQPVPDITKLGNPAVFHHTGAIRFMSEDGAPNLYVRHLVQHVYDADGTLRVHTDLLELLECR